MRRLLSAAAIAAAVSALGSSPAVALTSRELRTIHPDGPESKRGIGPVYLGESQANVEAILGPGREDGAPSSFEGETMTAFDYDAAGVELEVGYTNGAVNGVDTKSRAAILFGHPLADGLSTFRRLLRHRRHWRVDSCHHRTFTAIVPGGPGTGIEWRAGQALLVMVDVGGELDDCVL
jgi:hypothetical protein